MLHSRQSPLCPDWSIRWELQFLLGERNPSAQMTMECTLSCDSPASLSVPGEFGRSCIRNQSQGAQETDPVDTACNQRTIDFKSPRHFHLLLNANFFSLKYPNIPLSNYKYAFLLRIQLLIFFLSIFFILPGNNPDHITQQELISNIRCT